MAAPRVELCMHAARHQNARCPHEAYMEPFLALIRNHVRNAEQGSMHALCVCSDNAALARGSTL